MNQENLPSKDGQLDILAEIVSRRRADMAELGISFGCDVPKSRSRAVIPFLQAPGVILEVKRASPSKGNIAESLDAAETARSYQAAGARAISVLTERNFFKGSLLDLQAASNAATATAILRKDFILDAKEVEISFLCGADAILLIARILQQDVLAACIDECAKFGMTAFVEVRSQDDVAKINSISDKNNVICGVNARDLATFAIDPLVPVALKEKLGMRVVSESGILTPEAAAFTARLGFHGILVGEAAARNVQEAHKIVEAFQNNCNAQIDDKESKNSNLKWWKNVSAKLKIANESPKNQKAGFQNSSTSTNSKIAAINYKLPLVKICGLTNVEDALCAAKHGAAFLGFVFASKSPRCVTAQTVKAIIQQIKACKEQNFACQFVGVITDTDSEAAKAALELTKEGILDAIQFHDCKMFVNACGYAAVRIANACDIEKIKMLALQGEPRVLIDAFSADKAGGTGKQIDKAFVKEAAKVRPLWLAGGITPENVQEIVLATLPELIDVSSGVEVAPGKKDHTKIAKLFANLGDVNAK